LFLNNLYGRASITQHNFSLGSKINCRGRTHARGFLFKVDFVSKKTIGIAALVTKHRFDLHIIDMAALKRSAI